MWSDIINKGSESKKKRRRIDNWSGWKKGDEKELKE